MKKRPVSIVIISLFLFAIISISLVSAGFGDWFKNLFGGSSNAQLSPSSYTKPWCNYTDVNRDGFVNSVDLGLVRKNFGSYECNAMGVEECNLLSTCKSIWKVVAISNDTSTPTKSTVELKDIKTGNHAKATIYKDGYGSISLNGKSYEIYYIDDRNVEEDEMIIFDAGGILEQRVYKRSFIVI